jgi:hypothetical protein
MLQLRYPSVFGLESRRGHTRELMGRQALEKSLYFFVTMMFFHRGANYQQVYSFQFTLMYLVGLDESHLSRLP